MRADGKCEVEKAEKTAPDAEFGEARFWAGERADSICPPQNCVRAWRSGDCDVGRVCGPGMGTTNSATRREWMCLTGKGDARRRNYLSTRTVT